MDFSSLVRDVNDFPEKGIVFKDITPLLKDPAALNALPDALLNLVGDIKIDKVVGVDSRGFIFAPM